MSRTAKKKIDKFPELRIICKDGRVIEVFRRKDRIAAGPSTRRAWSWRVRRNGRVTSTSGQGVERCSAIRQAKRAAGPGAKVKPLAA